MDESYYAVVRSGDNELAHYGVKGMKWGVRKAIAAGSDKKMARAYKKASKHLKKLQNRANIDAQKANVGVQRRKAIGTGLAAIGAGGVAALTRPKVQTTGRIKSIPLSQHRDLKTDKWIVDRAIYYPETEKVGGGVPHLVSGGLTVAGAAKTAYHTGKAIASKYRTTKKGHVKAVAKANAWKNEMDKAFAGTKYSSSSKNRQGKKWR